MLNLTYLGFYDPVVVLAPNYGLRRRNCHCGREDCRDYLVHQGGLASYRRRRPSNPTALFAIYRLCVALTVRHFGCFTPLPFKVEVRGFFCVRQRMAGNSRALTIHTLSYNILAFPTAIVFPSSSESDSSCKM